MMNIPPKMGEILDTAPPQNVEAEKQVLGSILLDPRHLDGVSRILKPSDFFLEVHGRTYRHLLAMVQERVPFNDVLILERLRADRTFASIGVEEYLASLALSVAVTAHAEKLARVVLDASRRRSIILAGQRMARNAADLSMALEGVIESSESALGALRTGSYDSDPESMFDVILKVQDEIDQIITGDRAPGIPIGLPEFDDRVGGVFPGELTILAARPGQGKTSLALQCASHIATAGYVVYFATLEMSRVELGLKSLCSASGVSNHQVRSGRIRAAEQYRLVEASQRVALPNLFLHDWPEIRPFDIQRAARRLGAQVVFVDYLQYVTPPDSRKQRYEQVGDISKGLKKIAREMCVPLIACAQIGRQADAAKEVRPKLSNLRESGNIENDCDVALLLWRPEGGIIGKKGCKLEGDRWDAELEVAKNRKGATMKFHLDWIGSRTLFSCHGYEPGDFFEEVA